MATRVQHVDTHLQPRTYEIYEEYARLAESLGPNGDPESFSLQKVMDAVGARDREGLESALTDLQNRNLAIRGWLDGAEVPLGLGGTHHTLERGVSLRLEGIKTILAGVQPWEEPTINRGMVRYRGGNDCFRRANGMAVKPIEMSAHVAPSAPTPHPLVRFETVGIAIATVVGGAMWIGTGSVLAGLIVTLVVIALGQMNR